MNFFRSLIATTKQTWTGTKILLAEAQQMKTFIQEHPDQSKWTRNEYLKVYRVRTDAKKLAVFGLVFIFVPEVIPFILVRGVNIIPSGFLNQDQKLAIQQKLDEARLEIAKKWIPTFPTDISTHSKIEPQYYLPTAFKRSELKEFAKLFGLGKFGTSSMITNRIYYHTRYLKADDEYLKDMDLKQMSEQEVLNALNDRGISRYDRSYQECIDLLKAWLEQNNSDGIDMVVKVKTSMLLNGKS
jgi:hypothetical protein